MKEEPNKTGNEIYPVIESKENGTLIIPDKVMKQITYLHGHIGDTEWSGILLYDVVSGSPADPKNFKLEAKHIFLMDIGTAGYTEYEADEDIVDIYDNIEDAMEMKIGHIHSHHRMDTFFSATDMSELNDNVDKHNYYLSLIVNFNGRYNAKVAFLSEAEVISKFSYIDDNGIKKTFKKKENSKSMMVVKMNIHFDADDSFFYDRYSQVKEKMYKAARKERESKVPVQADLYKDWKFEKGEWIHKKKLDDIDPSNLKTNEIQMIARNVISVSQDLKESRSVYSILFAMADSTNDELDFYYTFLFDNVQDIIEAIFDQELEADEFVEIIAEVIDSMRPYKSFKKVQGLIEGITDVLKQVCQHVIDKKDEDDKDEAVEANDEIGKELERLERELEEEKR